MDRWLSCTDPFEQEFATTHASGSCYRHTNVPSVVFPALREMRLMQAARGSELAEAEPHTPFASPTKRLKTPAASPAVSSLSHSPNTPQRPPARSRAAPPGGGLGQGRDDVDAALAAVSAVIDGSCAEEEHAQSIAGIGAGPRAGGKKKSGKVAAAAAGRVQTAGAEQSSQGVATPAKQPQARQGYTAGTATARDALAAAHKAAAKRIAQVLLMHVLPRPLLNDLLVVLLC